MEGRRTEVAARPRQGEETRKQGQGPAADLGRRAYRSDAGRSQNESLIWVTWKQDRAHSRRNTFYSALFPHPLLRECVCVCTRVCVCVGRWIKLVTILTCWFWEAWRHLGGSDQLKKLEMCPMSVWGSGCGLGWTWAWGHYLRVGVDVAEMMYQAFPMNGCNRLFQIPTIQNLNTNM